MATISIRQANGNGKGSCNRLHDQQLLPGIPDEITLHEISPKLPWKVFDILSAVSRAWGHAIRSRNVYDARALAHLTETFVVVNLEIFQGPGIGLWSMRENYVIPLPRIMHRSHLVVPFDGSIYILGREEYDFHTRKRYDNDSIIRDEVFVLDVAAGEKLWRKCASMREERRGFGAAVSGGKIYVCGGEKIERDRGQKIIRGKFEFCGSEVYDPKKDLWSPIKPMPERFHHQIEAVGEELFVHSGQSKSGKDLSSSLNLYHPGKDEWRVGSGREYLDRDHLLFVARGKLHSIDNSGIHFYDAEENSWTELHSFPNSWTELHSFPYSEPPSGVLIRDDERTAVVHVDGELLIKCCLPWSWVERGNFPYDEKFYFAKSNGFGGENKEIVWQKVPLPNSLPILNTTRLTTIRL